MRLLLATTNRGKLDEIVVMLAGLPVECVTLADYPNLVAPEETGVTFAENARQKATYYAAHTGMRTVAEDSGLEIDAMGGAPGVYSARFGGVDRPYPERFELIEEQLRGVPDAERTARFVCALALVEGGHVLFEAQATVEGLVARAPRGSGGFGYDPIFFYPPFGCTLAEAGEKKSTVSHRAKAFSALRRFLDTEKSG